MNILEFSQDPNAFWVLSGTTLLGLSSGVLGSFAFLRKQGLMGDVLSHAALPGICLAFLLTGSKHPLSFLIGAMITGFLATLTISWITRYSRIKADTAMGLVLSVFFGIGIVLLTQIQHSQNGNQSGLDKFLFGQSASIVSADVQVMGAISIFLLILCFVFLKELKLLCFDASYGSSLGFPMRFLDFFLMLLLVIAVVIGLQAAGVVLMAALLITPAAAARYWTESLPRMIIISAVIGALSGVIGTVFSAITYNLSTGPLIVLAASSLFFFSMLFAPQRGLLVKWLRFLRTKKQLKKEDTLEFLYEVLPKTYTLQQLKQSIKAPKDLQTTIRTLANTNKIIYKQDEVHFTKKGLQEAYETVLFRRMLEVWLMYESTLYTEQSIQQVETQEDILPDLQKELNQLLKEHDRFPEKYPYPSLIIPNREASTL
jgi:manganese/zinc/iron transport system permease protein